MWTVVYIAQSKEIVEKLKNLLETSGILVMVRNTHDDKKKSSNGDCFEILVPESEIKQAHDIIIDSDF